MYSGVLHSLVTDLIYLPIIVMTKCDVICLNLLNQIL